MAESELPKLLLIEDDLDFTLRILTATFESKYTVLPAINAAEARTLFAANPDIVAVVTDNDFPPAQGEAIEKGLGAKLAKEFRKYRETLPIILNSSNPLEGNEIDLSSVDEFIKKPNRPDVYLAALSRAMEKHGSKTTQGGGKTHVGHATREPDDTGRAPG